MSKKEILLNEKQQKAYDAICKGKNIFLTGSAGVGKSTVIKKFLDDYSSYKKIGITSTTGISAILIGGSTLHSYLGIGLGEDKVETLFSKIKNNYKAKQKWNITDVLIIDEVSMLKPELFEKLEMLGKLIRKNNLPFGGMQIILSGDFLQLPCVKSEKFVFESELWNQVIKEVHYLDEVVRQDDKEFISVLEKIRLGIIDKEVISLMNSRIDISLENEFGIQPTKLYCKNINVDRINNENLYRLMEEIGESYEYHVEYTFNQDLPFEIIQKYKKSLNIPEKSQFCTGCQVMLAINLDLSSDLANGSRGVITGFHEDYPIVQFSNGIKRKIIYQTIEVTENKKIIMTYSYLPLKLAYCASIHKLQGSTLDLVEVDLGDLFEYGQGYVALSRVKSLKGLSIKRIDYDNIAAHPKALEFYKTLK